MGIEDQLVSLSSNLVLLGVGAGVTGLLVPYFTRRWQDRQAALKLKEDLVKHIATSVTNILRATQSVEHELIDMAIKASSEGSQEKQQVVNNELINAGSHENEKERLLEEFKKSQFAWLNDCPGIGSTIHTYFHRSKIKDDWEDYYVLIQEFYKLTETDDQIKRKDILERIIEYTKNIDADPKEKEKIEENILANRSLKNENYKEEWDKLYKKIYYLKHELMANIIETNMAGFNEGFSWFGLKIK